jgi:2-polyprenyl-3-methyl-5-hydroxy-6-metoxy-1,4-benzoquinol methylase
MLAIFSRRKDALVATLIDRLRSAWRWSHRQPRVPILSQVARSAPCPQNALDIFAGEWLSAFPQALAECRAGAIPLFEDSRLLWGIERLGGVAGQRVLELGPLEGGHSYQLENLGAAEIVAVEASARAYLRCLIAKELLGMQRVRFLHGDGLAYLRENRPKFDTVIASGVLYHLTNPVELLEQAAQTTDRLFLWTHYYDATAIAQTPALAATFVGSQPALHGGFQHTLYRHEYGEALDSSVYCGGSAAHSHWLSRADILAALSWFGFNAVEVGCEQRTHPHGPYFACVARRQ